MGMTDQATTRQTSLVIEPGLAGKNYWQDLWRYRELMLFLAWRDIAVRYKQTMLGILWAVLRPGLTMLVFVMFRRVVGAPTTGFPEALLVLAGVLPWQFFSSGLAESSGSLIGNANLISKVYFPRMIVPSAAIATSLVDFAINLGLLALVFAWCAFLPPWQIVFLPFFVALTLILALGAGLLLAALNVEYRDFRYIIPFVIQFGIFVCPIAFTTADVPAAWRLIFSLNPFVGIIDGFRWCLLGQTLELDVRAVCLSLIMSAGFLWAGVTYFRRTERRFADVI